jgi:predicted PurR-regulated permease PerM
MSPSKSSAEGPWQPAALARATLIVGGLVVLALVLWQLVNVLLLIFGAIVVAIILRSIAGLIERYLPFGNKAALALACLFILLLVAAFTILLGAQISGQVASLSQELPKQLSALGERFGISALPERISRQAEDFAARSNVVQSVAGYTTGLVGVLANAVLVVVAGVYLAARPRFYRDGCLLLFPQRIRDNVAAAADNAGRALQLWLVGQLISMVLVAILTTAGLYLIGMPSALALGVLAGFAEFVPVVGPILSVIPAVLLAFAHDGTSVIWVVGLYLLIQQVESNVILPFVQRRTVDLPPALTLFALIAFGVLFGPLGILLATPLTVVSYVAVKQLYLRDALQEETSVPGEEEPAAS